MHRLRFLGTLAVVCALLYASIVLGVSNGSACSWDAELFDYTTKETTHFRMDETTPVKILLVQEEKGVNVTCTIEQSALLSIGIFQWNKVDILCRYPDDQMMTARATNVFDIFTGEVVTHPAMLFFSNARKYNETLYRLKVDCQ